MKAKILFLSFFSFSVLSFAGDCEKPISDTEHKALIKQISELTEYKVENTRSFMIGKCITADQMIEYLGLVDEYKDKVLMFDILADKLIKGADYAKVKNTLKK